MVRVASSHPKPPAKWQKLLRMVPGYDSVATAGRCTFDAKAADDAVAFFHECLRFIEGDKAGSPFDLEPWQQAVVGNLFGWMRPDGTRRYRECFIEVPRKNGKTPWAAGMMCLAGFCDNEPGAQIYSAAAEREQAALIYRHAAEMIAREPELAKRCRTYRTFKSIEFGSGSFYRALSSDSETKHGYNSHFVVVDELHAQPNRDLVDVLRTSTGTRRQPMIIYITTAGFDRNSICYEIYDYACKVRDGIVKDESFLPVIYEAGEKDDWTDPKVWRKANPNLGVSVSVDYLKRECERAKETPTYENTFRRLHLNQWTEQDVRWLPMDKWDTCTGNIGYGDLVGQSCYAGLDLSTTTDTAAFVMYFPEERACIRRTFIPSDRAHERERRDRVPYVTWANQGLLTMTAGSTQDYDKIRAAINEDAKTFDIKSIAADRWNAQQIITQLEGDGFQMVAFGQGFASMSGPSKELERLVISRELQHMGDPVLRWMASNCAAELDAAGNIKPSKKKSRDRIDGIVALVMGIGLAGVQPADTGSVYETRGVLTVG